MAHPRIWELHRTVFSVLLGGAVAVLFIGLHLAGALRPIENTAYDQRFRWLKQPHLASKDVVMISLDNASFEKRFMTDNYGRWPWDRKLYAQLLWYLRKAPARAIAIDITFAGRDPHENSDALFASQLEERSDTVLPFMLTETVATEETSPVALDTSIVKSAWNIRGAECGPEKELTGIDVGLSELNQRARTLATIRAEPESDGVLRKVPLFWRYAGGYYPLLALAAVEQDLLRGERRRAEYRCPGLFRPAQLEIAGRAIPVSGPNRDLHIFWYDDESVVASHPDEKTLAESAFRNYPVWVIADSALALDEGRPPTINPSAFKDKIVIIGAQAAGIGDIRPTPMSPQMPGPEVQATIVSNLLQGHFVREAGNLWAIVAILLMAVATCWAVWYFPDWRAYSGVTFGLAAAFVAINFALFRTMNVALVQAAPLGALVFGYAAGNLTRYVTEGREKKRYRSTLMKYVAPQLVEAIMQNPRMAELHNEKLDLTVLFSDVRGFTSISEKIPVDQLVATLNEFLNEMVEVIFAHGGTLDKFVGDCVMAIWGAPVRQDNHAELAARAALEMQAALKRLNEKWREQGRPELSIGVGINTGEMIFGNIGAERRMDFTVIGDNVNLASRLESSTKELKAAIVISEATYQRITDTAEVRDLGSIKVKGKDVSIRVYELLGMSGKEIKAYANTTKA